MIPSFQIDHTKLLPGVYVSRQDKVGRTTFVTTYDIRVCMPNREMMQPAAVHSIEHLMADYLRNDSPLAKDVIYFGPMGCMTGFYLILKGKRESKEIVPYLISAFSNCLKEKEVPGTTVKECGNCYFHNLSEAKVLILRLLETLKHISEDSLVYPK